MQLDPELCLGLRFKMGCVGLYFFWMSSVHDWKPKHYDWLPECHVGELNFTIGCLWITWANEAITIGCLWVTWANEALLLVVCVWLARAVQQRIHDLNQEMEARISVAIEAVEADMRWDLNRHFQNFYQSNTHNLITGFYQYIKSLKWKTFQWVIVSFFVAFF